MRFQMFSLNSCDELVGKGLTFYLVLPPLSLSNLQVLFMHVNVVEVAMPLVCAVELGVLFFYFFFSLLTKNNDYLLISF